MGRPWWNPNDRPNASFLQSCLDNLEATKREEEQLLGYWENWAIGDPRRNGDRDTPSLLERIRRAQSDRRHWEREIAYWRGRCVDEGDDQVPAGGYVPSKAEKGAAEILEVARRRMNEGSQRVQQPDRRLPREPEPF